MSQIITADGRPASRQLSIDGSALVEGFFDKLLQGLMIRLFINSCSREDAINEIDYVYKTNEQAFDASLSFLRAQNLTIFMQIKDSIAKSFEVFIKQINDAYDKKEGIEPTESVPENDVIVDDDKADCEKCEK